MTAQKRSQGLSQVPMSLAVIVPSSTRKSGVTLGSRDIELSVEGFALTNLGPGRNRLFIRGVADSPFDGTSQSTVAVQLDDARIIFDAPDPDLRLVDMARVEILKGPQGPLYGSGALGGIYHLVTEKPHLDRPSASTELIAEDVQHGGMGGGGEAIFNLPLVTDRLALRAVAYGMRGSGWIDNTGAQHDANVSRTYGGRLAFRWQPSPDWTIDAGGVIQYLDVADSQYVTSSHDILKQAPHIPEPIDNDFRELHATISGRVGGLRLVSASSVVDHTVDYTLDASDAAAQFGTVGPTKFRDKRNYRIVNQELRISPEAGGRWIFGLSYMRAHSHSNAVVSDTHGAQLRVESLDRIVTEYALFGEASWRLAPRIDLTTGARLYRTIAEDEAIEPAPGRSQRLGKTALSPSVALSWRTPDNSIVYLRYARALRPGGLAASGETTTNRYNSDELGTFDLGIRHEPVRSKLSFAASLFYTTWEDIQSDYLLPDGLVSTRNAGRGRIYGAEASIDWRALAGLRLAAGLSAQDARLTHSQDDLDLNGRRLPVAPDVTARLIVEHDFKWGEWDGLVAAKGNYIGHTRLALDQNLDRRMGNYAVFSANASFTRGPLTLSARIDNLLDIKGDSFAFGNPFSIMEGRQYTPLRPRTFTLSIGRRW